MDTAVSPITYFNQRSHAYFVDAVATQLESLLAPIAPNMPSGASLRGTAIYNAIEKARRKDDTSVPFGAWEYEFKRADWDKVSQICVDALCNKSKDLQLVAWLLEAQIHLNGFAAVAPCLHLIFSLCERYWESVHPVPEQGDLEFRANIISWINEKLLPALRQVPITACEREQEYAWIDWERNRRNEQIRANVSRRESADLEGASLNQLNAALGHTETDYFIWLRDALIDALFSMEMLELKIDELFDNNAPSLAKLGELHEQVLELVDAELKKRGIEFQVEQNNTNAHENEVHAALDQAQNAPNRSQENGHAPVQASISSRNEAYQRLAEAADFLMRIEPHSPAPYLVHRAIEWGRMNTADLYQELFLKLGGQLNIFEMLGLEVNDKQSE